MEEIENLTERKPICKFKVGDELICKPGFTKNDTGEDRGGFGCEAGKIVVVERVEWNPYSKEFVIWMEGVGIWERALAFHDSIDMHKEQILEEIYGKS